MSDTGADEALVGSYYYLFWPRPAASPSRSESLINMALLNHVTKELIACMGENSNGDLDNIKGSRENITRDLIQLDGAAVANVQHNRRDRES